MYYQSSTVEPSSPPSPCERDAQQVRRLSPQVSRCPPHADGTWQVLGESGSMDALVSPVPVLPAQTRDFSSVLRTFHTAP